MNVFNSIFKGIQASSLISFGLNVLFCLIMICALIGTMELLIEKRKQDKIKGLVKKNKTIENIKNLAFLKKFSNHLELLLIEKDKEGAFSFIFTGVLVLSGASLIFFVYVKQILLAILAPIIVLKVADELCIKMGTDIVESIEEQLPFAIDNIIRISSKYGDIKSIIYEASRTCQQPIKGILENMSREMISESPEKVLIEYAKKYDNVWFYSMVFTLISYLEDASKEETMKNLKSLRDILEKENYVKKASVTDKRYGVVVNLSICGMALFGFIFNLAFVPDAKEFFFSTFGGLLCFVIGITGIIITLFISINMSKKNKK